MLKNEPKDFYDRLVYAVGIQNIESLKDNLDGKIVYRIRIWSNDMLNRLKEACKDLALIEKQDRRHDEDT
jgi:hypothetical protein